MKRFKKYKISTIEENEKILRIIHRNWFDIVCQYLMVFLILFVVFAGFNIYSIIFEEFQYIDYGPVSYFMISTVIIILWIYSFLIWVDYYFDIWIITTDRIINVEQKGLFIRHVSELQYNKIEDVTVEINGFLQTMINYGDVIIQTAAESHKFRFRKISDPQDVKHVIMKVQRDAENRKRIANFKYASKGGERRI